MGKTVHISVVSEKTLKNEFRNISRPVIRLYPCGELVLLGDFDENSDLVEIQGVLDEHLGPIKDTIPVRTKGVDLYDFDKVFNKTVKLIRKYLFKGNDVYLNLSDAPGISLMSMMSAAYFVPKKNNIKILYSTSKEEIVTDTNRKKRRYRSFEQLTSSFIGEQIQTGQERPESIINLEIPVFPTQEVSDIDKKIMVVLEGLGGADSIKELMNGLGERNEEIKRSSLQYRLDKLEEMGMIERGSGKPKVSLTKMGKMYVSPEEE